MILIAIFYDVETKTCQYFAKRRRVIGGNFPNSVIVDPSYCENVVS